ncbi:hypothetical protein ACFSCX_06405 [Bacillus salitolerans]|uniref:Uncharacterized protein n=1 Tax=Bacillus salitolerans TaxID=1437434 RepID=A0ABW4LN58_9BACI
MTVDCLYVKKEDLNESGVVVESYFAFHICNEHEERLVFLSSSFGDVKREVNRENLLEYLKRHFRDTFYKQVEYQEGLNYCGQWYNLEQLGFKEELPTKSEPIFETCPKCFGGGCMNCHFDGSILKEY